MIREFSSADVMFIVMAVRWTLVLSAVAFLGGAVGGLLIALARTSGSKALRRISAGFIQVFQGTPLLMQLFLVYFGLAVVGLPTTILIDRIGRERGRLAGPAEWNSPEAVAQISALIDERKQ